MAFDSLSDRLNKALRNVAGKGRLSDQNMEDMLKEVRLALLEADVNYKVVKDFLNDVRGKAKGEEVLNSVQPGEMLVKIVHDELIELLGNDQAGINFKDNGITTIMLVGLQGTGKTTSVAKIARITKNKFNRKPLLIAADVIRPAAIEQLQTLGKEIDCEVYTEGTEVSALDTVIHGMAYAKDKGFDTVFIDTAGRLHNKINLMNELTKIKNVMKKVIPDAPHEILLVLDGSTGQNAFEQAKQFTAATEVNALAVTKLDGTAKGGVVIGISDHFRIPVKYIGLGEGMEDLQVFRKREFVNSLFGE